jgi:GntR family transcriptional regulator
MDQNIQHIGGAMTMRELLDPAGWLSSHGGPRYQQLHRRLEGAIQSGGLPPGTALPPERDIADMTTLSRVTVRKAMQPLVEAGLVKQRRGSGTVVAHRVPKLEQSLSTLTSFTEDMQRRGLPTSSHLLERGLFPPSPEEMMALGLTSDMQVARITRLRLAGDEPMAIERASLPPDVLPDPSVVDGSLYEVLGRDNNRPERALQRISAVNLSGEEARILHVAKHAAGLKIERTSYLPGGRVVEFTRSLYRGDAYDFVASLHISKE